MVLEAVVQYQSHNLILSTDMISFMLLNFSIFLSFLFFSAKIGIKVTRWIWKRMGKGQQNNSHLLMKFQMGFGHQEIVIQILMLNEKIWHSSLKTRCDIYHYLISLEMQGQPERECLCVPLIWVTLDEYWFCGLGCLFSNKWLYSDLISEAR